MSVAGLEACPTNTARLTGANAGAGHRPPAQLPVRHARLRSPRRGRHGKPGGMFYRGRTHRSAPTRHCI